MCVICRGEYDQNTIEIDCKQCQIIEEIPELPNLQILDCCGCLNIIEIPYLPNLWKLNCSGCLLIEEIPDMFYLQYLDCSDCLNIIVIPYLFNLTELHCNDCPLLLSTPINSFNTNGSKWLNRTSDMTNVVIKLQKRWKLIYAKRLKMITEFFISDLAKMISQY
jgi:hypothetical protein